MPQIPRTGTLEQVLRMLQLIALSDAFQAEVISIRDQSKFSLVYNFTDVNGQAYQADIRDLFGVEEGDGRMNWLNTKIQIARVTDGLRIEAPFPRLLLFGQRGAMQRSLTNGEEYRLDQDDTPGYEYVVDAVVLTAGTNAEATEREALILADALDRLIRRNNSLGGLVQHIGAEAAPAAASAPANAGGTTGGALLRWRVLVLGPQVQAS